MLTWEIIGVVFVVAFGTLIVGRRLRANVFPVLLVAGIAALGAAVTVVQVQQYRSQQASSSALGESPPAPDVAAAPAAAASQQAWPAISPMVQPPTGAAAPAAARNPDFNR